MLGFSENYRTEKDSDVLTVLHRIACIFCGLLMIYLLLRCYLSFSCALQDTQKFEHTGTFPFFLYFLDEEDFLGEVNVFLLVAIEFWMYIVQFRRVEDHKSFRGSILYFSIMLAIHAAVCLHANSLVLPNCPPYTAADEAGLGYRAFANMTIMPSVIYFSLYLMHLWKYKKIKLVK